MGYIGIMLVFQEGNSKRILEVFLVTWIALHHFTQREAVGEMVGRRLTNEVNRVDVKPY